MTTQENSSGARGSGAAASPDLAMARSILYETVAVALGVPDPGRLNKLSAPETSPALLDAASVLDRSRSSSSGTELRDIRSRIEQLIAALRTEDPGQLRDYYQRLFGHTARGRVTPYETEYGIESSAFRQTQDLADINGFYTAFGLKTDPSAHQRCDHIVAECEFMCFLTRKEAWLADQSDSDSLFAVRNAQRLFLSDHIGRFGHAFAASLIKEVDNPVYAAAGHLLELLLLWECDHFGVEPAARFISLRSTEEDQVPMACGSCSLNDAAAPPE